MNGKRWLAVLVLALAAGTALGVEPGGRGNQYPSGRKGRVCDAPGSSFYPDQQTKAYPPYGHLAPAPAFAWGYFGARSKPFTVNHYGYYRDYSQTIYPRGY
jgi:hypothetical protein